MHFNLFDIIIFAIFIGSILLGLYRGLVITSINIGSFLVTILLTIFLIPLTEEIVNEHIKNSLLVTIISAVIAYLLASFTSSWIAKRLKEMVENYTKGVVDRTLGAWIGAIRGYVICLTIFSIIGIITSSSYIGAKNYWQVFRNVEEEHYPKWLKKASTYNIMQSSHTGLTSAITDTFLESYLENISMPVKQVKDAKIKEIIDQKLPGIETPKQDNIIEELHNELLKSPDHQEKSHTN